MFDAIKSFVADLANSEPRSGAFGDREFRVAYAALLVHAATIDGDMTGSERGQLAVLLKQRFELANAAVDELIAQAVAAEEKAVDFYHFTHAISGAMDETDRLRMIEMMWTVAFADGKISDYEDNLIWRVADLLGVSSEQRIALRQRVAVATGNA